MGTFGGWMRARRQTAGRMGDEAVVPPLIALRVEDRGGTAGPVRGPVHRPSPTPAFAEDPASRLRRLEALRHDEVIAEPPTGHPA
jgi:hypothetical protein